MSHVTVGTENGADIQIYYKDWGSGQPIVFSHGWPLSFGSLRNFAGRLMGDGQRVSRTDRKGSD